MKKLSDLPVHNLIGGMTTDYFEFWCEECLERINGLEYYGEDTVGYNFRQYVKNVIGNISLRLRSLHLLLRCLNKLCIKNELKIYWEVEG